MANITGQSLGRYHILEQLGEGGMATVYKAYDTRLEADVAVKVIRTEVLPQNAIERALKRFEREAKSLARLTHPNVVKVTDYGEYEGKPYLVMPYLPGGTLKARLGQPMPWLDACKLLLPIAQALDYAHEQGLIHRDVKPSNILLTHKGQPMLSDFGIAKILDVDEATALTGTGMGVGIPEYMAPEQWTGKTGPQSDQYGLGVVLYEMVTGRKPYTADTPAAILLKQASDPLPRPTQFVTGLPEAVEKVLLKVLAHQPEDRYTSMEAFAAALDALIAGQPRPQAVPVPVILPVDSQATLDDLEALAPDTPTQNPASPFPIPHSPTPISDSQTPISHSPFPKIPKYWHLAVGLLGLVCLGALVLLLAGWLGNGGAAALFPTRWIEPVETNTSRPTAATLTRRVEPVETLTPALTATPRLTETPAFTATPELRIGSTLTREKDGMVMVYVPEGPFMMGSDKYSDEKPVHTVTLDAYWIDSTEVTNGMYMLCVQAGFCLGHGNVDSSTRSDYYGNSQYNDYPVIYVYWNQAKAYCEWSGSRLPSEAEWEKAARGTNGRTYPWGENIDKTYANYTGNVGDTSAVGSYPAGVSPYGAYDLAGNVWEWVNDWYGGTYYGNSPSSNPPGPGSGDLNLHGLRGGAWNASYDDIRSANRGIYYPTKGYLYIGFRCALSQ